MTKAKAILTCPDCRRRRLVSADSARRPDRAAKPCPACAMVRRTGGKPLTARANCLHCRRRRAYRWPGLCVPCHRTPEVRALFPVARCAGRGVRDSYATRPLPPEPTCEVPGTPGKLAVLEARAAAGLQLFHPLDGRWEGDPRPLEFLKGREGAA